MVFYQKLKLRHAVFHVLTGNPAFYCGKSILVRAVERLLRGARLQSKTAKLEFGDVRIAPGVRRRAYEEAEKGVFAIDGSRWARDMNARLGIDFQLLFKKIVFDELYLTYEFFELAIRYAMEHPGEPCCIHVEGRLPEPYETMLREYLTVRIHPKLERVYVSAIVGLPLILLWVWRQYGTDDELRYENAVVCQVDGERTYEMFQRIFETIPSVRFVIERRNVGEMGSERLRELNIGVHGLTRNGYRELRGLMREFIVCTLQHVGEAGGYGSFLLGTFYVLALGRAEAIEGRGNWFFTYEHLVTTKAARNEFLKAAGSRSIFVPLNAHLTPKYFHSEIFVNYDLMCAAGNHTEPLYREKRAVTDTFLPTGSYDSHRGVAAAGNRVERIARLRSLKGDSIALTIVSPGVCAPTYSHEVRLMELACQLARQPGVKVFVRLKPVPPSTQYAHFYDAYAGSDAAPIFTFFEHELLDFLEVTDLFITSISNAASDLALCGGQVMFIDYMKDPEMFPHWEAVREIVLSEEDSFHAIMRWVNDEPDGLVRGQLRANMKRLTQYVGFSFGDFPSYRSNLLARVYGRYGTPDAAVAQSPG